MEAQVNAEQQFKSMMEAPRVDSILAVCPRCRTTRMMLMTTKEIAGILSGLVSEIGEVSYVWNDDKVYLVFMCMSCYNMCSNAGEVRDYYIEMNSRVR